MLRNHARGSGTRRPTRVVADGYDQIAERYRAWTKDGPVRLEFLDLVLRRLKPDSRVIELGCGAGDPATRRLSERHDVIAFDASSEQVRLAREAAPGATVRMADVTELDLPRAHADAVIAFYLFGHLPPEAHRPLLSKAVSWLRPGGLLVMNFPITAGAAIDPDWLGVPMYFGGIGEQATLTALTGTGLIVERVETIEEDEDGSVARFLWVVGATAS